MFVVLFLFALSVAFYVLKSHYNYWEKRGIPGPKPKYVVGNMGESFLMRKSPLQIFNDLYSEYPDVPLVGFFRTSTPSLLVRDPDLIKEFVIKSFDYFHDNDLKVDKKTDPLISRNPFFLRGEEWKIVRTQLTPAFTSGKMKSLYPLLEEVSQKMVTFIEKQSGPEPYEAKELCTRFTLNNVASCAFGIEGKCFDEENSEFRQIARNFLTPGTWSTIKILTVTLFPFLADYVNVKLTPKSAEDRITNIVTETLKYRQKNNIVRNDFLHIMNELKKTGANGFTDDDVSAHAAGFIADGYETSSVTMSFLLYEIAANVDVQEKLRREICENFEKNGDRLPYEILQEMPYLEAVLNESLRLNPPGFTVNKRCTKDYTYVPKDSSKPVVIEKGTPIIIPTYGIQRDSKYFDRVEKFDPERFMGANKDKIKKYTFMPFGEGPRSCLGQRFARLQIKLGLAYIVKNYELTVNKKTRVPFEYDPMYFMILPLGGLWIEFKKISLC